MIHRARVLLPLVAASLVAGCTLPRSGPYTEEIRGDQSALTRPFDVVDVTAEVVEALRLPEPAGFSEAFTGAGSENFDRLGVGDTLSISIWEGVESAIFAPEGSRVAEIEAVSIDQTGAVFVPFVGRVRAAGRTPHSLREAIRDALQGQTLDPQVEVRVVDVKSRTVTVGGIVAQNGVYPLERTNGRLLSMISLAGGVTQEPQVVRVKLRRDGREGVAWLQALYDDPALDVALRAGDTILLERDRRTFTALGAVAKQSLVPFPKPTLSALEALGAVAGLDDRVADPTGIFVFRTEDPALLAAAGAGRPDGQGRVAYVIDLTRPDGMFVAGAFEIRAGDSVYVTNSPFTRFQKILGAIVPAVNFAGSVSTLGGF